MVRCAAAGRRILIPPGADAPRSTVHPESCVRRGPGFGEEEPAALDATLAGFAQVDAGRWPGRDPHAASEPVAGARQSRPGAVRAGEDPRARTDGTQQEPAGSAYTTTPGSADAISRIRGGVIMANAVDRPSARVAVGAFTVTVRGAKALAPVRLSNR